MSGSLSSVILIAVVWLLLLTPLFLRRHQPVRRTSKALSETRVLHEGGTGIERPHRRPLPAESLYHADPDEDIELVDAEPEQVLIDDTPDAAERAVPTRVIDGEVVGYRPLDDEDTGEFPPVDVDSDDDVVAVRELGGEVTVVVAEDAGAADTDDTDDAADTADTADTDTVDGAEDGGDTDDTDGTDEDRPDFAAVPVAYFRGGDTDVSVGTDDTVVERAGLPAVREPEQPEELTDEDLAYAAAHRGRGFYDPVTSQELAERRQTRRRRTLAGLGVLLVLAVVGGVFVGGAAWAAVVVMAALTGVYLYYLRRQTVEEQELRHRRIARMRRARAGVRSTDDSELGVPDRLLRPGAVALEIDDEAPEFAALPVGDYLGDDSDDGYGSYDGRGGYDDRRSYRAV
ncbi:MAG: hypothetical protein L0K27_05365 [Corynebacterium nuruki]|nr:hypothetical protein [Corynebacterium nuruki]